ncbi:MAG: glycosyl hydrolase [Saprospiraceae bacterium]|nr:glycosyl hydrolase [Saprospiraceae bacterium]
MGESNARSATTSHGDGVYKSLDGGKTWKHIGLPNSRHIASIRIHPQNPDVVWTAVQGALFGKSAERGVYKTIDGGKTWRKVLYVDENTGACDISLDWHNPRILYAGMWDHRRYPWAIRSGGPGSGLYKSIDGGESWVKLKEGLPEQVGKVGISVSPADPEVVYAIAEATNGGIFRSNDGGISWIRTNTNPEHLSRAWYYTKIFADPSDTETVYVLNVPLLKSTDGGKTFEVIPTPHSDHHDLWINPQRPQNIIVATDGGTAITFNGGGNGNSWSSTYNQPTAQLYRVVADQQFPYSLYAGQQDYGALSIPSRTFGEGITDQDWQVISDAESAFVALDPATPNLIYSTNYQGNIFLFDQQKKQTRDIMAYPSIGLDMPPFEQKYRFNWNAPVVASPFDNHVIYHAANVILRTEDGGMNWDVISPDLTRNDPAKQGAGGGPYTNEGAGGENYNTISYMACSPHQRGFIWAGSDDGLVHLTFDEGKNWQDVTPSGLDEALINCIEVSPHEAGTAYVVASRYKFDDFSPLIYYTKDYGKTWKKIVNGIEIDDFVRVVREDPARPGLLYAGTETGIYVSFDYGESWQRFQLNLPTCPVNDLLIHDNDLVAATSGRGFWILDDLGSVQQSVNRSFRRSLLFKPKPARLHRTMEATTAVNMGQNPLPGVIIDYFLPLLMAGDTIALEIFDSESNLIRSYYSHPKPAEIYVDKAQNSSLIMANRAGINRFYWDMRRTTLPIVADAAPDGNDFGSLVGPGVYTLRFSTSKGTDEQKVEVLPDPRLSAMPSDYVAHQEFIHSIELVVSEINASILQMRAIKQQAEHYHQTLALRSDGPAILIEQGKIIVEKISSWEKNLLQVPLPEPKEAIAFPKRLCAELINLRNRVDGADPFITGGARNRLADLLKDWERYKADMYAIINTDVTAFNLLYQQQEVPPLILPERH